MPFWGWEDTDKDKENKDAENKDKENKDEESKDKENKDEENKDKENKDEENKDKENNDWNIDKNAILRVRRQGQREQGRKVYWVWMTYGRNCEWLPPGGLHAWAGVRMPWPETHKERS